MCIMLSFSGHAKSSSYLGGTINGGSWTWIDGSPFNYTNWPPSGDSGEDDKNCLELVPKPGGPWGVVSCNTTRTPQPYICSMDGGMTPNLSRLPTFLKCDTTESCTQLFKIGL